MEKRKEYAEGEIITCPKCGGDDLDYEEAPDKAKCLTCGLEFTIRQVAVWEEMDKDTIFVLTREDVIECVKEMGIPDKAITDDILRQVRKGVESGLGCWSEVVKEAINMALKS
jgi:transcription elongation factor Elf1